MIKIKSIANAEPGIKMAKTYNNLFHKVCSFQNLLRAAQKAQKNKRFKENTARFNFELENMLLKLSEELLNRTYRPGSYHRFLVYEPKKRLISAAPYRDRVVHHALCNVIEPIFEKTFIYDSYANRAGKGTHAAILRFQEFCRKNKYMLKCDIKKYFDSIDRGILIEMISKKIKDKDTLDLIKKILFGKGDKILEEETGVKGKEIKGIPLGNLTSQFFANLYLNGLDHFIKEELREKYYIRYVDDFVVFGNDKERLWNVYEMIKKYLSGLGIELHPVKTRILPVNQGAEFLGFRIFPEKRLLKKANFFRFRRRLLKMKNFYHKHPKFDIIKKISQSVLSWVSHAKWGDTAKLREKLFNEVIFK